MKRTALHVVSEAGHASIVVALINNNANFDAVDCEGQLRRIIYNYFGHIVPMSFLCLTIAKHSIIYVSQFQFCVDNYNRLN